MGLPFFDPIPRKGSVLIQYKWYRRWRVLRGARSFYLHSPKFKGRVLLSGPSIEKRVEQLNNQGYIEEWPKERT